MLIDEVAITVSAGNGGDGVVRFSKTLMTQGPTGGNGGNGGNVSVIGVSDLGALRPYRHKKSEKAEHGGVGGENMREGADGKDCVIKVPLGTRIHDVTNNKEYEVNKVGESYVIARGGNGGFGNYHFRSSRNTTPTRANKGQQGETIEVEFALRLIADVGFVGYPNVGKSSLLNELTNASSKVANYQFTTLEPHLGVYYDVILADIPGLIEGAAEGKGLGHRFLRHVERTSTLFHFVAADSQDPLDDYDKIRAEIERFNPELLSKKEYVMVSRSDEVSDEKREEIVAALREKNPDVYAISILDEATLVPVKKLLTQIGDDKKIKDEDAQ